MHRLRLERDPNRYQPRQIFWAAPVTVERKKLYVQEVRRVAREFNFSVVHGNRHVAQQSLLLDLSEQILYSRAVICDVTGPQTNNVMIECGIALGLGRDVAVMGENAGPIFGQRILNLPSDLRGATHFGYEKGTFALKLAEIFRFLACRPGAEATEQQARAYVEGTLRAATIAGRGLLKSEIETSTGLSESQCLLARNQLQQLGYLRSEGSGNATRWFWNRDGLAPTLGV